MALASAGVLQYKHLRIAPERICADGNDATNKRSKCCHYNRLQCDNYRSLMLDAECVRASA